MPRTTLTPVVLPGKWAVTPGTITFAAGDVANGNDFVSTGREILIARNTGVGARTITIDSAPMGDSGREGDITAFSIAAGAFRVFQMFPQDGWMQSDGKIWIAVEHAEVNLAVLRVP